MARFVLFILLATITCMLVNVNNNVKGQLSFSYKKFPEGNSMNKVSKVRKVPSRNRDIRIPSLVTKKSKDRNH